MRAAMMRPLALFLLGAALGRAGVAGVRVAAGPEAQSQCPFASAVVDTTKGEVPGLFRAASGAANPRELKRCDVVGLLGWALRFRTDKHVNGLPAFSAVQGGGGGLRHAAVLFFCAETSQWQLLQEEFDAPDNNPLEDMDFASCRDLPVEARGGTMEPLFSPQWQQWNYDTHGYDRANLTVTCEAGPVEVRRSDANKNLWRVRGRGAASLVPARWERCREGAAWPAELEFDGFDWLRTEFGSCQGLRVRDQGSCATCWSFGIAASMSTRLCISTNMKADVFLSPVDIVTAVPAMEFGRSKKLHWRQQWGYFTEKAYDHLQGGQGIRSLGCAPYRCISWISKPGLWISTLGYIGAAQAWDPGYGFDCRGAWNGEGCKVLVDEVGPLACGGGTHAGNSSGWDAVAGHLAGKVLLVDYEANSMCSVTNLVRQVFDAYGAGLLLAGGPDLDNTLAEAEDQHRVPVFRISPGDGERMLEGISKGEKVTAEWRSARRGARQDGRHRHEFMMEEIRTRWKDALRKAIDECPALLIDGLGSKELDTAYRRSDPDAYTDVQHSWEADTSGSYLFYCAQTETWGIAHVDDWDYNYNRIVDNDEDGCFYNAYWASNEDPDASKWVVWDRGEWSERQDVSIGCECPVYRISGLSARMDGLYARSSSSIGHVNVWDSVGAISFLYWCDDSRAGGGRWYVADEEDWRSASDPHTRCVGMARMSRGHFALPQAWEVLDLDSGYRVAATSVSVACASGASLKDAVTRHFAEPSTEALGRKAVNRVERGLRGHTGLWRERGHELCGPNGNHSMRTLAADSLWLMGDIKDFWRAVMEELRERGPVPVEMNADFNDQDYYRVIDCVDGAVYGSTMTAATFHNINHVMSLVGWGTVTALDGSRVRYWLVQNSWGHDWEMGGFIRVLRGRRGDLVDGFEQMLPGEKYGVVVAAPSAESVHSWERLDDVCRQRQGLVEEARYCLHGEVTPSCACRCHGQFSGMRCDACVHECSPKETLDESTCSCQCRPGLVGPSCGVHAEDAGEGHFKLVIDGTTSLFLVKDPCFGNGSRCAEGVVWEASHPTWKSLEQWRDNSVEADNSTDIWCGGPDDWSAVFVERSRVNELGKVVRFYDALLPGRLCTVNGTGAVA